jgi:hypothetical protein
MKQHVENLTLLITQDANTIFINEMLNSHAFRKLHVMLGSKIFNNLLSKAL